MVRTSAVMGVAIALLSLAPVAHAIGDWTVGVTGGVTKATGDFGKDLKVGPLAGVEVCLNVTDRIAIGAEGSWTRNEHKDVGRVEDLGFGDTYTLNEARIRDISGGVHARFSLPTGTGMVSPYGLLGAGFYSIQQDYKETYVLGGMTTVNTDESDGVKGETRFGGKLGAGVMLRATGNVGVGVQGEYNIVTLDTTGAPAGTPSTFKFWGVRAGLHFKLMSMTP